MDGAKAVKRHNAQYDIFNRLHSIASDQTFVEKVAKEWFQGRFEIVRKAVYWFVE
jgi:tRNA A64-2'-O-ribosylphosphate transferase